MNLVHLLREAPDLALACRAVCAEIARARGWDWPSVPLALPDLDWGGVHPLDLGAAYAAARAGAKVSGRYYTPAVVAARVVAAVGPGTVCDPACGAGHLLLAAADRGLSSLHGIDRDPVAVELCRFTLFWASDGTADRALLARQVRVGDALREDWGRYDAIIGNPPYRAGRLSGLRREHEAAHAPTAEYQVDPYVLFMDRALRFVRPGGRVALVVPNAWASNHRSGALRRWIAGDNTLERVIELPVDTFDATVETVIVVCAQGGATAAQVPVEDLAGEPRGHLRFDRARPEAPLPLVRDADTGRLLDAAAGWSRTLGDVCEVTRGVNPYHRLTHTPAQIRARVHHADHQVAPDWQPEIRGRDLVAPYRVEWRDHWIHYGPWLKEPRKPRFFEGPRLLVRKILGRTLHATYWETPMVCDQSVYIARLLPESGWSPWTLLGCLNSALMAQLLRARHQEDDQLFPQLKVRELREAPLPPGDPDGPLARAVAAAAQARAAGEEVDVEPAVRALYGV